MGTVTCCKRPNEVIEDKDLLKKATIKRDIRLKKDISKFSGQESSFVTINEKENHNIEINSNMNNSTNNIFSSNAEDENKLIDLEKENLEHEPTIGPSDNLRKRKLKNTKNQNKTTIKIPSQDGVCLAQAVTEPDHHSVRKELNKGRLLFYVKFDGGEAFLDKQNFDSLFDCNL